MPDVSTQDAAGAAIWFTSQAGITALVLALFCIVLIASHIWSTRQHRKERAEETAHLFGDKESGEPGVIPGLVKLTDSMRKEVWAAFDDFSKEARFKIDAIEERRRVDTTGHHQKLDGIISEVGEMAANNAESHSRVESAMGRVEGALHQQSQRLSDMISLASKLAPPSWDGQSDRRTRRK